MAHIGDGAIRARTRTEDLDLRWLRSAFSAAFVLSLMLGVAPAAVAAEAAKTPTAAASSDASKPVDAEAGGPIDVQIWPQANNTAVIAVVEVDASTKLPVTVRIPVMPGTMVEWAGEIMGGQASGDIEQPFTLRTGRGGLFVEFTLTKSHRGQVDSIGFPLNITDQTVELSPEYVQSVSSTMTAISVRLPADISKVKISPKPSGEPVVNADRESLYVMEPKAYELGESQKIDISYSTIPPGRPGTRLGVHSGAHRPWCCAGRCGSGRARADNPPASGD